MVTSVRIRLFSLPLIALNFCLFSCCHLPSEKETIAECSEKFKDVKRGMTREQVQQILGIPDRIPLPESNVNIGSYYYGTCVIIFDKDRKVDTFYNQRPFCKDIR